MRTARTSLVLVVVGSLLTLAACGSDEDDGTPTGATTGASSSSSSGSGASGSGASGSGGDATSSSSSSSSGEGGSAGEPGVGGEGGSATCPSTHTCAETAPANWTGPVVLSLGDTQPACVGTYPTTAGAFTSDLDPGLASCSCTCGAATGIECNSGAEICYFGTSLACNTQACLTPNATILPGACTDIPGSTGWARVTPLAPSNAGSCASGTNHTLPAPTWATQAKACGGATTIPDVCEQGSVCTPVAVAPFDKLCIERTGEVACPNQFYSEQHVVYEGFTDTRACSACSCGAPTSTCGGDVAFTYPGGGNQCGFLVSEISGCGDMTGMEDTAIYSPAPSGSCAASASTLSGEVTTTGPVTFCCHP